jgi:hypothetical protein
MLRVFPSLVMLTLFASCTRRPAQAPPQNEPVAPITTSAAPPATGTPAEPVAAPAASAPAPVAQRSPKVKIIVRSIPPKAIVFWGKKKLGETPVTLERPRDSGPVDLVVRSDGFFPIHTRAYTFHNDTIYAKLTKVEERMSLFGAKHDATTQLPAPPPGSDPGAPAPSPLPPAPTPTP